DYWPLHRASIARGDLRKWMDLVLEKAPLLLVVVIVGRIAISTQQRGGSLKSILNVPWQLRITNVPLSYIKYVGEALWPVRLAVLYPLPSTIPVWQSITAVLALLLITALVLTALKS